MANYTKIELSSFPKKKQYTWFRSFENPCYGFTVKIDVSRLVEYSKNTNTSFFINMLFIVTKSMSEIEEFRLREVDNEIRLYDEIDPSFTVMTKLGIYENVSLNMNDSYKLFYKNCKKLIDTIKNENEIKESFNDKDSFNQYYITCIPWISFENMIHPIPDKDYNSNSVPRIAWDKYEKIDEKYLLHLNITVSHCFVDGYPLSNAFKKIQNNILNIQEYLNN